jgi:hypothetical protein
MRLLWHFALPFAVVMGLTVSPALPAVAQGEICFAKAMRGNGDLDEGTGKSQREAAADAISKCRATAWYPDTCRIVTSHCHAAPKLGGTNSHRWIDGLRQTKIPINWQSGLVAAAIHLLWIWHIVSKSALAVPTKAGLSLGVPIIQAALIYVLGSEGDIGLLELPIFVLPLGLGEFVASVGFKRHLK